MNTALEIQVDDRERNETLLTELRQMEQMRVTTCRLKTGDFLIDQQVVIERKTVSDFATSLIDGRLFAQASRMLQSPLRPAYIIEGGASEWKSLQIARPALQGALISLMLIFDIPVLRSTHPKETAHLLSYIGQQLIRARSGGQVAHRAVKAKRRATRQRRLLQTLPGVGPDRATRLLEHFGSVRACLNADVDTLASIEGIGPATAKGILHVVE